MKGERGIIDRELQADALVRLDVIDENGGDREEAFDVLTVLLYRLGYGQVVARFLEVVK